MGIYGINNLKPDGFSPHKCAEPGCKYIIGTSGDPYCPTHRQDGSNLRRFIVIPPTKKV